MNCNTTHYRANSSSVPGDPTVHDGVLLEEKTCRSVLRYAAQLWGYTVKLLEVEAATDKTLKTYESGAEGK